MMAQFLSTNISWRGSLTPRKVAHYTHVSGATGPTEAHVFVPPIRPPPLPKDFTLELSMAGSRIFYQK